MTAYITDIVGWQSVLSQTQTPGNAIHTISLANNIRFTSLDEIYGEGGVLGERLMTLRGGQTFEGNGFTITIDAPPQLSIGLKGLFSLDVSSEQRCVIQNLRIVLTDRTMIGSPDNPYQADSPLVSYNTSLNPRGLVCDNIIVESDAMLTEGCCLMHGVDPPCQASACFVRVGAATTEAEPSAFFDPIVCVFSKLPSVVNNCALVSDYNFRVFYPSFSLQASGSTVSNIYMDLSSQTAIPDYDPPSALVADVVAVRNPLIRTTVEVNGAWIWWGDPSQEPNAYLVNNIGYFDFLDDPVPGYLLIQNLATNIPEIARDVQVGEVSTGPNVLLSQTEWSPSFPFLTDGFDYGYNPPILSVFRQHPFNPQAILNARSLPQFDIAVCVATIIDGVMTVRATASVSSIYNLTSPLSYWVQGSDNSNSTTVADDSPWTRLPDNQFLSEPVVVVSPHTPHPKLQLGLTTFTYPRIPQYLFFSIPLPDPPVHTLFVLN